jgi:hypothetical protein
MKKRLKMIPTMRITGRTIIQTHSTELADLDNLIVHPFPQSDWEYRDPDNDEDDSDDLNTSQCDYPDSDSRFVD